MRAKIDFANGKTHLTIMNAKTILSAKGQVVIPKDVRDALHLKPGQELDVIPMGGGVLIRPEMKKSGRSFEEIVSEIRSLYTHEGPPVSIEQMDQGIAQMFRERGRSND